MVRLIVLSTLLATSTGLFVTKAVAAANLTAQPAIKIQFDNGSPPIKDSSDVPLRFGDSFFLEPGESFTVGGGSSFFSFTDFPDGIEQVKFHLDLNPGDSFLNLNLPGGFDVTVVEQQSVSAFVKEGEALSIAYGYYPETAVFANTKFTLEWDETTAATHIPEPSLVIACGVMTLALVTKKLG